MSPGNGFFTDDNIFEILQSATSISDKVYVVIPDSPHVYNFLGIGYDLEKAKKKAKKDNNQTKNRLKRALNFLKDQIDISRVRIIDWDLDIESNYTYQNNYQIILHEYKSDSEFQHCINRVTFNYLQSRSESRSVFALCISEGVKYYLKELALFTSLPEVLEERPTIGYYKQWGEGLEYLEKMFPGFSKTFAMIQYQVEEC